MSSKVGMSSPQLLTSKHLLCWAPWAAVVTSEGTRLRICWAKLSKAWSQRDGSADR